MDKTELKQVGESFLPDHSKDRWRKEIARLAGYSERMVRYWEQGIYPVPMPVQSLLRTEFKKNMRKAGARNVEI